MNIYPHTFIDKSTVRIHLHPPQNTHTHAYTHTLKISFLSDTKGQSKEIIKEDVKNVADKEGVRNISGESNISLND